MDARKTMRRVYADAVLKKKKTGIKAMRACVVDGIALRLLICLMNER